MKAGLLIVERIVIEALAKKDQNLEQLKLETGLGQNLLQNVLSLLLMKNIIHYQNNNYSLSKEIPAESVEQIFSKEGFQVEAKELFSSLVNQYFDEEEKQKRVAGLRVQKIAMSESEFRLFCGHLNALESFMQSIKENRLKRPQLERVCDQKVVFWGHSNYRDLVGKVIESA